MKSPVFAAILLAASLAPIHATTVAVFDDPTHVNSSGGASAASDAVQALLTSLGYTVSPFTGITAGDFSAALAGANLILFPDLLNFGALASDLSAPAKTVLANYVSGGGGLIVTGGSGERLLNVVFYPTCDFVSVFCFASSGTSGPSFLDSAVAAGTAFASAPATLDDQPQPPGALNPFAFTPPGGLNLYRDQVAGSPNGTTVLTAPFGSGKYGFLAWDFTNSVPLGSIDGG